MIERIKKLKEVPVTDWIWWAIMLVISLIIWENSVISIGVLFALIMFALGTLFSIHLTYIIMTSGVNAYLHLTGKVEALDDTYNRYRNKHPLYMIYKHLTK